MNEDAIDFPDKPEQYYRPSQEDVWYLLAMVLVGFIVWGKTHVAIALLPVAVVAGLGYIQRQEGRVWFVLLVSKPGGWWLEHVQDGLLVPPEQPDRRWLFKLLTWLKYRVRSPTEQIEVHAVNSELATYYNTDENTDTVLIEGEGSDTAMTHASFQEQDTGQIASMVRRLALVRNLGIDISWIRGYRPSDPREAIEGLMNTLHPDVLPRSVSENQGGSLEEDEDPESWGLDMNDFLEPPSEGDEGVAEEDEEPELNLTPTLTQFNILPEDEKGQVLLVVPTLEELAGMSQQEKDRLCNSNVGRNFEHLLYKVADESSMCITALAITIKRDASLANQFKDQAMSRDVRGIGKIVRRVFKRSVHPQSMAEDEEERLIVEEIVRVAIEGLELAGVERPRAMDFLRLHRHFRYSWDIQQDDQYAKWASTNPDLNDPKFDGFQKPQSHERAKGGVLDNDGNFAAVIRITAAPREAEVHTFRPLYAIDVPHLTAATITRTGASDQEVDIMEMRMASREAFHDEMGGTYQKQKTLEREDRAQHTLETAYAAKYRVRMNFVFVILAKDRKLLAKYVEDAMREINAVPGMRSERITNPFTLVHWFWTANGIPC